MYVCDWPRFKRSMCVWIRMNVHDLHENIVLSAGSPRRTMSCLFRIMLFVAAAADDSSLHRPQCLPFNCCIHSIAHFLHSSIVFPFTCYTGQYRIQDLDKVMYTLNKQFGKIAKVGGLIGHPDLLFVFDGDEIRNIFKKEETLPHRYPTFDWIAFDSKLINIIFHSYFRLIRPSMPSLHHYKANLRRDFFGDDAGLIGVYVFVSHTRPCTVNGLQRKCRKRQTPTKLNRLRFASHCRRITWSADLNK